MSPADSVGGFPAELAVVMSTYGNTVVTNTHGSTGKLLTYATTVVMNTYGTIVEWFTYVTTIVMNTKFTTVEFFIPHVVCLYKSTMLDLHIQTTHNAVFYMNSVSVQTHFYSMPR